MSVLAEPITGRPQRKQLSDQLDRLDGIIDCLADGLNEAVAGAVRDGTQAVRRDRTGVSSLPRAPGTLTISQARRPRPSIPERADRQEIRSVGNGFIISGTGERLTWPTPS